MADRTSPEAQAAAAADLKQAVVEYCATLGWHVHDVTIGRQLVPLAGGQKGDFAFELYLHAERRPE
jgi:hypothetical protein